MAFIRAGNQTVSFSHLSFFLLVMLFNTTHFAHNYYGQFSHEEASSLAHDHAPQLARPRETVQVATDTGEVIEVILPHENFSGSANTIPTKPTKSGEHQQSLIGRTKDSASNKVAEAKKKLQFISDENINLTKERGQIAKQECIKLVMQGEGSEIAKKGISNEPELSSTQFTAEELEFLAQFKPEPKDIYKTVVDTREQCRIVRPRCDYKAVDWTLEEYDKIRSCTNDIDVIAKNTGWPLRKIKLIKEHLFINEHILPDNVVDRFAPDEEIAAAWDRLFKGDYIKNDIKLLRHELAEALFEKKFKIDYQRAHDIINKTWYWYNPNFKE
ncbi:MAG: hypothetical protein AB7F19_00640 [Candidatus Babeliales bacterium]